MVDFALCETLFDVVTVLLVHGCRVNWNCHDGSHRDILQHMPSAVCRVLYMNADVTSTRVSYSLFDLTIRAVRAALSRSAGRSIWPTIDCLSVPVHLKPQLKLTSYIAGFRGKF